MRDFVQDEFTIIGGWVTLLTFILVLAGNLAGNSPHLGNQALHHRIRDLTVGAVFQLVYAGETRRSECSSNRSTRPGGAPLSRAVQIVATKPSFG